MLKLMKAVFSSVMLKMRMSINHTNPATRKPGHIIFPADHSAAVNNKLH